MMTRPEIVIKTGRTPSGYEVMPHTNTHTRLEKEAYVQKFDPMGFAMRVIDLDTIDESTLEVQPQGDSVTPPC